MLYNQAVKSGFSTVAIISGAPRFNKLAAKIIDNLKAVSTENINFVGAIGNEHANKLEKTYLSNEVLDHDEIVIHRNYNEQKI